MESRLPLLIKRLTQAARLPTKGSKFAAGYDLYSAEDGVVPARGKGLIKTGISIAVPPGNYGRVAPRSGLAVKNFIDVGAGVVDEDYRGEVGVVLFNHSDIDFKISIGDRIAQLIIEKITDTFIQEVNTLDDTSRGAGGFGSTGVSSDTKMDIIPEGNKTSNYNPFLLNQEMLSYETQEALVDDGQWKEWSILVLYSLCESGVISVDEKKYWASFIFNGDKRVYEHLRNYVQESDFTQVRDALNNLSIS